MTQKLAKLLLTSYIEFMTLTKRFCSTKIFILMLLYYQRNTNKQWKCKTETISGKKAYGLWLSVILLQKKTV